jgi:hypothetical protein
MPKLFFIVVASKVQGDAAHYIIPLREILKNLFIYWEWSCVKHKQSYVPKTTASNVVIHQQLSLSLQNIILI